MSDSRFPIPASQYINVLCFLTFNVTAMLGSLATSWVQWPRKEFLVWPVLLRVVFIPLLLVCNYRPNEAIRVMPIYITNDWIYWAIGSLMGFTSGYLRYFLHL